MDDYISREAAIDHVYDCCMESCSCNMNCIKDITAAEVKPVVHAKWIEKHTNVGTPNTDYFCSNCNFAAWHIKTNYCPNCGSYMREGC